MSSIRFYYTNLLEQTTAQFLNGPAVAVGAIMSCTAGSPTITRSGGSFSADGVKRWSAVSGGIAGNGTTTGFPAGTRVSSVGTTTLTMSANCVAGGGLSSQSGTFTPTNALVEDSNYPMVNLFNGQRGTPWDPGPVVSGTIVLEFDLTSSKTNVFFALLGLRANIANGSISAARLYGGATYGTWSLRATIVPNLLDVDAGVAYASAGNRFLRVELDMDARTPVSGLWVSNLDQDLGIQKAPGWNTERIQPVSIQRTPGGFPIFNAMGQYERRRWVAAYGAMTSATRAKLESVFSNLGINGGTRRIPVMLDDEDRTWEMDFADRAFAWSTRFVSLDSVAQQFESLP